MTVHVGTSGWSYDHWADVLYPPRLPPARRLATYVEHFRTVELNASFYRWPRPAMFAGWHRRLPAGFEMAVKAPRWLTHGRRLLNPDDWVRRIEEGLHELGDRRGPLVVQLPPDLERDDGRLDGFLGLVPTWIRVTVEFRHPSWHDEAVFALLERHGAAYCVMSGAKLPCVLRATAPFVYVRLHGPDDRHLYAGSYSDDSLRWWAERIGEWRAQHRDVYAYFNNDGEGNAVRDATTLLRHLR
ncbi:DUF72 domain-containing protein [Asanoa siamensis]|uniref:Sensor histidine kinase n=1 Tax=Asanoa siamensis TaxID=926357 RepID=A0ABQ4CYR2_9ACTN|nr:DUF72 domain-containing protein [Asanoa siamensis]GIF76426.1 hypothetical protein Asi02nite_59440 [Asanoa siamensis]